VCIESQNFNDMVYKDKTLVPRESLLNNLSWVMEADLYITAIK